MLLSPVDVGFACIPGTGRPLDRDLYRFRRREFDDPDYFFRRDFIQFADFFRREEAILPRRFEIVRSFEKDVERQLVWTGVFRADNVRSVLDRKSVV